MVTRRRKKIGEKSIEIHGHPLICPVIVKDHQFLGLMGGEKRPKIF